MNETKFVHITFPLCHGIYLPIKLNNQEIPVSGVAKYLGLHIDKHLTWQTHIFIKKKQLSLKLSKLYWQIERRSPLSFDSKLTLYKSILKPVWAYEIQPWETVNTLNIGILQRFQSKTLKAICNALWFVTNETICHDLNVKTVRKKVICSSKRYLKHLKIHPNYLAVNLLDNS